MNPGDEVLYPDPGFPSYRADIELAGGIPIAAPLLEARNFSFDLDFLADHMGDKTKLLILNSPSNPTGGTIPREDLETIAQLAIERDVWVMTDEIYGDLVYDDQTAPSFYSIEAARHRTILVDGFSKSFAMTGWRLGFAAMPKALAEKVALLTMHAVGCTAGFTQVAGVTALEQCREAVNAQKSRLPGAARPHRRWAQLAPGRFLRQAQRRLLRLSQRDRSRHPLRWSSHAGC